MYSPTSSAYSLNRSEYNLNTGSVSFAGNAGKFPVEEYACRKEI
jgi:hypothetical protein